MNNQVISYIRTFIPWAVGAALTWVLIHTGIDFTGPVQVALIAFLVPLVQDGYYLLVRLIEQWLPWVGVLLGWPAQPIYLNVDALWASLVRTIIPSIAGAIIGFVVSLGLALDPATQSALIIGVVGIIQYAYYALARTLVAKWPGLAWLLGTSLTPTYAPVGSRTLIIKPYPNKAQ